LRAVDGVHWAEINAALGRVIVDFDGDSVDVDDLLEVVAGVEDSQQVHQETFPLDRPDLPGDLEPIRRVSAAIVADLTGLGLTAFGNLLRATPLPIEAVSVLSMIESEVRLRRILEDRLGPALTDLGLATANALAQGLAQGPTGLLVDLAHRASLLTELQARRRCWEVEEPALWPGPPDGTRVTGPARLGRQPVDIPPRPAPLPDGPVESYGNRVALTSLAAAGGVLFSTASPRRAAATVMAAVPKGARLGREAFAAQLGRTLSDRRVIVLNSAVLRRLDRVDTLVVNAAALQGGEQQMHQGKLLVTVAHRAGLMVAVASDDPGLVGLLGADLLVPGGKKLTESVRMLQGDGCVIGLVSGPHAALAAADCGIGLIDGDGNVPWAADLVCGIHDEQPLRGMDDAVFVVDAVDVAHEVSRQSATLAVTGSAVASVLALISPTPSTGSRAMLAVNGASLVAMVNGTRAGLTLTGRPRPSMRAVEPWHELPTEEVLLRLGTSYEGLPKAERSRRAQSKEDNNQSPPAPVLLMRSVVEELVNPLMPVLLAGAGASAAVGSGIDAAMIAGVAGLNAMVGGLQRFRARSAIAALRTASAQEVLIRQNGEVRPVHADTLVPGDVVLLAAGDAVPADCRLLEAVQLEVDESSLTGESEPVGKSPAPSPSALVAERTSMLYEGTGVAAGSAVAVVVAVGSDTEAAASEGLEFRPPRHTGVETHLRAITARTLPVAAVGGAAVVVSGVLRGRPVSDVLGTGVNLAVAAVPEGLPVLSTLAQLAAAGRLSARGALVRNPRAVEALGRVEVLCVDKTGTLTAGHIELHAVSDGRVAQPIDGLDSDHRLVLGAALRATPEAANGRPLPHLTDRAVRSGANNAGVSEDVGAPGWQLLEELHFEPSRAFHATLSKAGEGRVLSVKGAPEVILPACTSWRGANRDQALDGEAHERLRAEIEALGRESLRVLAVAERPALPSEQLDDASLAGLTLLGLLALADPVRPEAAEAVSGLRRAGVNVVMVTGDHPSTAEGIAKELGILNGKRVVTGAQLDGLADDGLDRLLPGTSVFARVTPADKVRIVAAFQRLGSPVAMTGDGVNDAPAIRLADVGLAIGAKSTPAARAAADVVITDERVETIIDAIIEGRAMWRSVRDALGILVGGNLGEIVFTVGGSVLTGRSPLSTRQLLLVNLLTDVAPALAIALRPPHPPAMVEDLVSEGPERSLGSSLEEAILLRGAATAAGAGLAWGLARFSGGPRRARTVALAALVGTQLGQTLAIGGRNPVVIAAALGSTAALAAIVQTPGVSQFFGCTPLDPAGWAIAAGSAAVATSGALLVPVLARRITSGDGRSPAVLIREEMSERPLLRLVSGGNQG
jgi:cation-transporting ATPase I